jgi:uncharacterized phage protein (TIGR01671 family)
MREHKYRVWDKKRKTMINFLRIAFFKDGSGYVEYENKDKMCEEIDFVPVPETYCVLMQYIGLKDKNGKEIYEDDFLEFPSKTKFNDGRVSSFLVEYLEDRAAYVLTCRSAFMTFEDCMEEPFDEYIVIGNKYENPELLEINYAAIEISKEKRGR